MKNNWFDKEASCYGIIKTSVANMRLQPVFQSEMINQVILGDIVPVFEEQNDFFFIRKWDGYLGWINKHSLALGDKKVAASWQNTDRMVFVKNYGFVKKDLSQEADIISDLVYCAILKKLDTEGGLTKVELPDGQKGFVEKDQVVAEEFGKTIKPTQAAIMTLAKQFLGIPYLWGGTSTKAFDCSGFVQTVYRLFNISLPRNASQMAQMGTDVSVNRGYKELEPGDLLFFGKTVKRLTHVALSLGSSLFIHSEGLVRMNSLDRRHSLFNEHRHKTLLKAKRLIATAKKPQRGEVL